MKFMKKIIVLDRIWMRQKERYYFEPGGCEAMGTISSVIFLPMVYGISSLITLEMNFWRLYQ
jgi:hypothetical protein